MQEKRIRPRAEQFADPSVHVEINLHFGTVRRAVYQIAEYHEEGLSFMVPSKEGYFLPGTPLEFRIVKTGATVAEGMGLVCYYQRVDDSSGVSFYKIGLKVDRALRPPEPSAPQARGATGNYQLALTVDGEEKRFVLTEVSRFSAAFACDTTEAMRYRIGHSFHPVTITFGEAVIFQGRIIVGSMSEQGDGYRIVVEPRHDVFNIDLVEAHEALENVRAEVGSFHGMYVQIGQIDQRFKAIVAEMYNMLDSLRKYTENPVFAKLIEQFGEKKVLDILSETFTKISDDFCARLETLMPQLNLSDEEMRLYRRFFQQQLHPLHLSAPFWHRTYFKPLGYAGDFMMMRMIVGNEDQGPSIYAKVLNRYALNNPLSLCLRNRNVYLCDAIISNLEKHRGDEFRILSFACGPALEIERLIKTRPELSNKVNLTLLDQEVKALRFCEENISRNKVLHNSDLRFHTVRSDIAAFLRSQAKQSDPSQKYNLIYFFGIFDYFNDRMATFCMNQAAKLLAPNGHMIVANYSLDGQCQRTWLELAAEWYLIYRNRADMERLGPTVKDAKHFYVTEEPSTVIKFLHLQF